MPERPSVLQTTQVGVESTAGVVVPCTKRLLCTQIDPVPNVPTPMYRPAGNISPTTATSQKEWVQANLSGVQCFNDLVYLLSGCLKTASISPVSGGTLTRRWTFKPAQFAADTFTTFTVEKGTLASGAERFAFGLTNSLNLRYTRTDANLTGVMMGQALAEQVTISSGGVTDLPALPVDPKSVTIYAGSTQGVNQQQTITITGTPTGGTVTPILDGIVGTTTIAFNAVASAVATAIGALPNVGTNNVVSVSGGPLPGTPVVIGFQNVLGQVSPSVLTFTNNLTGGSSPTVASAVTQAGSLTKLLRVDTLEVAIPDRYAEGFTLNEADTSFSYVVQKGVEPTVNLILEHDSVGAGFMTDLRARTTKFMKIIAHGAAIETGFSNWIQIFFPFFFTANTRGDQNDVYASTYTLGVKYDSTFGGWIQIDVDNAIAAL